jgi:hypothetical protein
MRVLPRESRLGQASPQKTFAPPFRRSFPRRRCRGLYLYGEGYAFRSLEEVRRFLDKVRGDRP